MRNWQLVPIDTDMHVHTQCQTELLKHMRSHIHIYTHPNRIPIQFCNLLNVYLCASYLTSLFLNFSTYEMGAMIMFPLIDLPWALNDNQL